MRSRGEGRTPNNEQTPRAESLVRGDRPDCFEDVGGAGQDRLLENRGVGDWTIQRGDTLDRRVEVLKELFGNPGGDLGTEAARQLVLGRR
jgi:hypothetical protein